MVSVPRPALPLVTNATLPDRFGILCEGPNVTTSRKPNMVFERLDILSLAENTDGIDWSLG